MDVEAGFFFDFAEDGLNRIFVGFDVSAGWEPGLDAVVPVEEGGVAVDDEAGGGEVAGDGGVGHCLNRGLRGLDVGCLWF